MRYNSDPMSQKNKKIMTNLDRGWSLFLCLYFIKTMVYLNCM